MVRQMANQFLLVFVILAILTYILPVQIYRNSNWREQRNFHGQVTLCNGMKVMISCSSSTRSSATNASGTRSHIATCWICQRQDRKITYILSTCSLNGTCTGPSLAGTLSHILFCCQYLLIKLSNMQDRIGHYTCWLAQEVIARILL